VRNDTLIPEVVFNLGPVEVTVTVIASLIVSVLLLVFALLVRRGAGSPPSAWWVIAESLVDHLDEFMQGMSGRNPRPYTPLIATLALFVGLSNLMNSIPGFRGPTADLSTTAALAVIVFVAVPFFGIRERGLLAYLRHYIEPVPFLLPFEVIGEFSRTLALAVRLFGNVISGGLIVSVIVMLVGVLVPLPFMALTLATSMVHAYIFAALAMTYISASIRAQE
jgi:F-type H+-transporting ATPase subunit a